MEASEIAIVEHLEVGGVEVPRVGLGTWGLEGDTAGRAVREALDLGYRHIDTAQAYGNEAQVGRAVLASGVPRADLFITTKLWRDSLTPSAVARSAGESLDRLRTDYVDLLLIHWPVADVPLAETLAAMGELVRGASVRLIGVCNFPPALFRDARASSPVCCNQVEYHPYLDQRPLLDLVRSRGAFLTAYSPLARGRVLGEGLLKDIARRHGRSPAQVVLRWLLDREGVVVIPKSAHRERLAANLDVWDFALDAGEARRIDGLACGRRLVNPSFAPAWEDGPREGEVRP